MSNKFNGITTTEFKLLCPQFMTDYVLMRQKYSDDAEDSRFEKYVFPQVHIHTVLTSPGPTSQIYHTEFFTKMRIRCKKTNWFFIVAYRRYFEHKEDNSEIMKVFLTKCYEDVYRYLFLYIISEDIVSAGNNLKINKFDIYQGNEFDRLKLLK